MTSPLSLPSMRLRRLRRTSLLRDMVRETRLGADDLIYPVFVEEGIEVAQEIPTMPDVLRVPERHLARELEAIVRDGVRAVLLLGISHHKDTTGSDTCRDDGLIARIVRTAKSAVPELLVITDNCFCEHTGHGHCKPPLARLSGPWRAAEPWRTRTQTTLRPIEVPRYWPTLVRTALSKS